MNALIVANGIIQDYKLLKSEAEKSNFILCVDGGVDHILKIGLQPDIVFGDLDSISPEGLSFIEGKKIPIMKFPSIKDSTDTELAIDYLIKNKYKEIIFMGVIGSRQDHTMGNIFLLNYLLEKNAVGRIIDDNNIIYLIDNYLKLEKLNGYYTSIIPIKGEGIRITLEGFFYDLKNSFIPFGSTIGISNEIISDYGEIKIHEGKALVFQSRD